MNYHLKSNKSQHGVTYTLQSTTTFTSGVKRQMLLTSALIGIVTLYMKSINYMLMIKNQTCYLSLFTILTYIAYQLLAPNPSGKII